MGLGKLPLDFLCPVDAGLRQAHGSQEGIVIRILRGMHERLLGLCKSAASGIEIDFFSRLGALNQHANMIVEHLEKSALDDEHILLAGEGVGEDARLEPAEERGVIGEHT